jgi:hypothetical protein
VANIYVAKIYIVFIKSFDRAIIYLFWILEIVEYVVMNDSYHWPATNAPDVGTTAASVAGAALVVDDTKDCRQHGH